MRATVIFESNAEENLSHYTLFWGMSPGQYSETVDDIQPSGGPTVRVDLTGLPDRRRVYVAVSATNTDQQEGPLSDEVSKVNRALRIRA